MAKGLGKYWQLITYFIYFVFLDKDFLIIRVFHISVSWGSFSDSKSPQVSRTLLSILAIFNNAVVWMVSTRPPTSKSSRPFNDLLVTVPKAPITIGIIVTFMFHSFFQFSSKIEVCISLFTFFQLLLLLLLLLLSLQVFNTNINWWSFTGVWVTVSLFRSTGLFSVF